tara:strand:+ start:4813 stop:6021 length:1209 start_codon:yes stop_codon:yes gene_type:complete
MAFTTLVDYSRQLTQSPDTTAIFSGDTQILGSLTLGNVPSNSGATSALKDYSILCFSSSSLTTSPVIRYNSLIKNWEFKVNDPDDASATEFQLNKVKFSLNTAGMNGEFGMYSQQSFFRYTSNDMDGLQNTGYHNPATVMVVGSGITSSSTAFTVSNFASGVGKTGFTVDDAMNVFIGDMRPQVAGTSTSHVWLRGNTLNNVESHKTLMIGTDGQVGVNTSLRSLKQNIDYEYDSTWLYDLKPVEFEFRKFPGKKEYGFIAEDVEETNKNLAIYESDGRLSGVKYEAVAPIILKELIELRKTVDPTFKTTYEEEKVKVISKDYKVIHDGTIIARGGGNIKITISEKLSGVVRIKSLANVTVDSTRLIDEKWGKMELEDGSSVSLLCHDDFIYILSSDGDKLK